MPFTPKFPYNGHQLIYISDRVILHAKDDAILLFGKKAIGLSSRGPVNIDSNESVTINSPIIELGIDAQSSGEPILKGNTTVTQLSRLLDELLRVGYSLSKISETNLSSAIPLLVSAGESLASVSEEIRASLEDLKSTVTYTK